ncbi:MAG: RNase adapter RapZ, partial [Kiloniellales bacterium]
MTDQARAGKSGSRGKRAGRPKPAGRTRVTLITGMSGAGHSSALKAFEDLGYEAVDNLPLSL